MFCRQARTKLSAYIDRMLPQGEMKALSEHLEACERCEKEHQRLCQMVEKLASSGNAGVVVPDQLWESITERMQNQTQGVQPAMDIGHFERIAAALGLNVDRAAVILSIVGIFIVMFAALSHHGRQQRPLPSDLRNEETIAHNLLIKRIEQLVCSVIAEDDDIELYPAIENRVIRIISPAPAGGEPNHE